MHWLNKFDLCLIAVLAIPGSLRPMEALAQETPAIFGTREVRNSNLAPFTKWTRVLAQEPVERSRYGAPCTRMRGGRCTMPEWRELVRGLRGQPPMRQLDAVHRLFNRILYVEDPQNWGVPDYWATPLEFITRDGDCEDYAIAKYVSLRELGFQPSQMRILVLNDLNLRIAHAILVVFLDGRAYLLDNQISTVVPMEVVRHYQPIFSINEDAWWLHQR